MNPIYLDIGNSSFKLASKDQENKWCILIRGPHHELGKLEDYIKHHKNLAGLVYSSVRKDVTEKIESGFQHLKVYGLHSGLIPSANLNYETPGTLGMDRFLACYGAIQNSGKSAIVIDAGTACTIDYMTKQGVFQGGVIMPGIAVLKKSMNELLPELPQATENQILKFPGKSTIECINIGLFDGFKAAIMVFIQRLRLLDQEAEIYVTGGDSSIIESMIGREFTVIEGKFLLFDGMEAFIQNLSKLKESDHLF